MKLFFLIALISLTSLAPAPAQDAELTVVKGQLTFDAEGNDDSSSPYYSRTPHVPSGSSGLTIGRGYDLKERAKAAVINDLKSAGLAEDAAKAYAGAVGKKGDDAKKYIKDNKAKLKDISKAAQKKLFEATYEEIAKDVKRICEKADVVQAYGKTEWAQLSPKIKDVLVDLRFRGDYTPSSRRLIQKYVASNDLAKFKIEIQKKANWANVPEDRFKRRSKYLD